MQPTPMMKTQSRSVSCFEVSPGGPLRQQVAACEENWLPFAQLEFGAYFEGKRLAEEAAAEAAGVMLRPRSVTRVVRGLGGGATRTASPAPLRTRSVEYTTMPGLALRSSSAHRRGTPPL